jgi:hypothetical protein
MRKLGNPAVRGGVLDQLRRRFADRGGRQAGRWIVAFEYDYHADEVRDEAEAARAAFSSITDPQSMMPVATVTRPDGTVTEHDLMADAGPGPHLVANPEAAIDSLSCHECGAEVWISQSGTAHHWGAGPADIDHDADADHVPVPSGSYDG